VNERLYDRIFHTFLSTITLKKTRAMPDDDLALARKRLRELEQ